MSVMGRCSTSSKVFRLLFQYFRSISTKLSNVDNQSMEHLPIDPPETDELAEPDEMLEQVLCLKWLLELAENRNRELLKHFREAA
jgi:hypothetical protein